MGNSTSNITIPPLCQQPLAFPIPIINAPMCDPGYFCPNINAEYNFTFPSVCSPTIDCIQKRLGSEYCAAQGIFEPILCLAGHYCPNFTTMLPCPENTYCIRGSVEPEDCPTMSICPALTQMRRFYGGIIVFIIFDLIVAALYFALKYYYEPRLWKARKEVRLALHGGGDSSAGNSRRTNNNDDDDNDDNDDSSGNLIEMKEKPSQAVAAMNRFRNMLENATNSLMTANGSGVDGGVGGGGEASYASLAEKLTQDTSSSSGAPPASVGGTASSLENLRISSSSSSSSSSSAHGGVYCAKTSLEQGFKACNAGLRLDLEFTDLRLTLPAPINKTILSDVCGKIRPGRVTAIMGPSGAGKTTFLSVLMGRVARTSGILKINGAADEMYRYKKITGFVPQDDTMISELTVRENILFSARVRLPRHGWTDKAIEDHVDAVIDVLGLSECADTLSQNVSGGQRKRTNIGMELVMAPAAIFLDEPTSGLDSTAALEVCKTLKSIADLGLTVVAVIHQPRLEIFETFDDLLLLAPGGLTVYMGPQIGVLPYFKDMGFTFSAGHNPADDLLDFVAGKGTPSVMEGFWTRMGSMSSGSGGGGGKGGGGLSVSPDSSFTADALNDSVGEHPNKSFTTNKSRALTSYASLNGEETGSSAYPYAATPRATEGNSGTLPSRSSVRVTRKTAHVLSRIWLERGPQYVRNFRITAGALLGSSPSRSDLLAESPTSSSSSSSFSASSSFASKSGLLSLNDHSDGGPCTASSFDPVSMTNDRGASFLRQVILCHNRSVLQQYRQSASYALEMGVGLLAGGMMGAAASQMPELYVGVLQPPYTLISPAPIETLLPSLGLYIALAIGIAGSPAGVRTFGEEKAVYYREAAAGHSRGAYYVAKTIAMFYRFTLGAFHFSALFHFLASPSMPFSILFFIVLAQYFAVYGLAAVTSMIVNRENSALLGVIVSLVAGCLCGFGPSLVQMQGWGMYWIQQLSYARWGNEAFFHYETLPYRRLYLVEDVSAALFGYTLDRFAMDMTMIFLIGTAYRVIAFFLLVNLNKDKQR